jgi:hypothetical protein
MKLNKTNCKLNTCIKRRRVYLKNMFSYRKNRLRALLFRSLLTTFFIFFSHATCETLSFFFNRTFCKDFLRVTRKRRRSPTFTQSAQKLEAPNFSNVNFNRGSRRRSHYATLNLDLNEPSSKFINTKRGAAHRSPKATVSASLLNEPNSQFINTKRGAARRSPKATVSAFPLYLMLCPGHNIMK